jgi:hypothetical protein
MSLFRRFDLQVGQQEAKAHEYASLNVGDEALTS